MRNNIAQEGTADLIHICTLLEIAIVVKRSMSESKSMDNLPNDECNHFVIRGLTLGRRVRVVNDDGFDLPLSSPEQLPPMCVQRDRYWKCEEEREINIARDGNPRNTPYIPQSEDIVPPAENISDKNTTNINVEGCQQVNETEVSQDPAEDVGNETSFSPMGGRRTWTSFSHLKRPRSSRKKLTTIKHKDTRITEEMEKTDQVKGSATTPPVNLEMEKTDQAEGSTTTPPPVNLEMEKTDQVEDSAITPPVNLAGPSHTRKQRKPQSLQGILNSEEETIMSVSDKEGFVDLVVETKCINGSENSFRFDLNLSPTQQMDKKKKLKIVEDEEEDCAPNQLDQVVEEEICMPQSDSSPPLLMPLEAEIGGSSTIQSLDSSSEGTPDMPMLQSDQRDMGISETARRLGDMSGIEAHLNEMMTRLRLTESPHSTPQYANQESGSQSVSANNRQGNTNSEYCSSDRNPRLFTDSQHKYYMIRYEDIQLMELSGRKKQVGNKRKREENH